MQKTAYEMRISDGSSDVCSSDLLGFLDEERFAHPVIVPLEFGTLLTLNRNCFGGCRRLARRDGNERHAFDALGRAGSTRAPGRSEERRVGKECVSKCRSRGAPYN